jgi:AAA+ ATPase superfamily predicted ATPase
VFIGRSRELAELRSVLQQVERDGSEGRCVLLRGRRRVGKSRLIEAFCQQAGVASMYMTAARAGTRVELERFRQAILESDLPDRSLIEDVTLDGWDAALRLLAQAVPQDTPSIVVIDEFPYLVHDDPTLEVTLQRVWDRWLSRRPTLLILVGSDLSMMEALDTYDRPFHQRGVPMVLEPLNPAAVATMTGLPAPDAFDAYLITGGLPVICRDWPVGASPRQFLESALASPTSALVVSAERVLAAEFPAEAQAQAVLAAIGTGERTRSGIGQRSGGVAATSLTRSLDLLRAKRVVAGELPLSTVPSRERRYRVADPYLRFWLRFVGPYLTEIDRGRSDRVLARLGEGWASWRGRAVEPVIREAVGRLSPGPGIPDAPVVGAYWTRTNDVEVDLVGADREPVAQSLAFLGTIKWRDGQAADVHDLADLVVARNRVPGADETTPLVVASRSGADPGLTGSGSTGVLDASDLLRAWSG